MRLSFLTWLRGLALLRHPQLVADFGHRLEQLRRVAALRAANPGAKVKADLRLLGDDFSHIRLGPGSIVSAGTILTCGNAADGPGQIEVGAGTYIGECNNLRAGGGDIRIGENCLISQFCTLVASNHARARGMPIKLQGNDPMRVGVVIGNDVWLGAGCVILPGVVIGEGAIVAANAVVTRSIPSQEIWGGVPARKLGERQ